MTPDWATQVVDLMITAADEHGVGALAFDHEESARAIAALAGFMRLGAHDGRHYDITASQIDPVGKPHLWAVTITRREEQDPQ